MKSSSLTRCEFVAFSATAAAATFVATSPLFAGVASEKRFEIIGFTKPFQNLNFSDTADTVAEVGWDGIECPVRPEGQIEPERAADQLPELVAELKKRGKAVSLLATSINSVSQPYTEPLLRTAAKLGIKRYRLGVWQYDGSKSVPDQLKEIAEQFRDLAVLNKELGLQAGLENHSGRDIIGAPVWDAWTMMRDLDPRYMGICYDIGHATIEGGLSWPVGARLMERWFSSVFVKDFVWQRSDAHWRVKWVMLGEGMVNKEFFTWLKSTNFSGPICQHHEYDHGAGRPMIAKMRQDLKVLREWLAA